MREATELGIAIYLLNQVHQRIDVVFEDAWDAVPALARKAPVGSTLWGIHMHADTMFNMKQLSALVDQLDAIVPEGERERQVHTALCNAADSAIRQHGYLWFSGD